MNEKSVEYKMLNKLINTYIVCIMLGIVGVWFKVVHVEFMEGVVFSGLLNLILMLMKDLFFTDQQQGETNGKSDNGAIERTAQPPSGKA